jgi:hypothetical protein
MPEPHWPAIVSNLVIILLLAGMSTALDVGH